MAEGSATGRAAGFAAVVAVQGTTVAAFEQHLALGFAVFFPGAVAALVVPAALFLLQGLFHLGIHFPFREHDGVLFEDVDEDVVEQFFQQGIGPFERGAGIGRSREMIRQRFDFFDDIAGLDNTA